jgi:hypothetical protein
VEINLSSIADGLSKLGLDAKPVHQLSEALTKNLVKEQDYIQVLNTLKNQLLKKYSIEQKPMALRLLLTRLEEKLEKDLKPKEVKTVTDSGNLGELQDTLLGESSKNNAIGLAILRELRDVRTEMQELKESERETKVVHVQASEDSVITPGTAIEDEKVFVSPIDEKKVSELKPSIKIEAKEASTGVLDRVARLKKLKDGN